MAKRRTNQNPGQTTISRFMLIVAFFAVWIGVIGVRLVYLQINQGQWLHEKALGQRRGESKIKTLRGSILDRSNRALAVSVKVKSMYADPRYIEDVSAISERLATALNSKQKEISDKILEAKQKKQNYVLLARKLDEETAKKVSQQLKDIEIKKIDGQRFKVLYWADEQKRSYPYNSLAAQVIGFSDLDDNGKAGIELSQDRSLCGVMIETWQVHDRLGRVYDESEDGKRGSRTEVVLTLSNTIQFKVEEALKVGVEEAKAKSGVAIVLDPKTGEILAMANYPTFDLNKFSETLPELYSNKSIQNAYAPGSVFKLVTYGSALEEKVISPNELIDCNKGEIVLPDGSLPTNIVSTKFPIPTLLRFRVISGRSKQELNLAGRNFTIMYAGLALAQ